MSETTPAARTPTSVERMSSSRSGGAGAMGGGGFGNLFTILLAVACVLLIGACFYISSGKKELQTKLDTASQDLKDTQTTLATREQTLMTRERDIASFRAEIDRRIPLGRLPAMFQAPTVNEAIAKIQQLSDTSMGRGGVSPTPMSPANDTPVAWLETITKQVIAKAINTSEPAGNDAAKVQMHKGIQIVLNKIGAYPKAPTGNSRETFEAVTNFQKANGLKPDGIIGRGTWSKVREKFESVAAAR